MNDKINPFLWLFVLFSSAHFKIYNGYESKENKGFQRVLYEKNNFFQRDGYKWIHNCWFVYPYENTSILKEIQMSKSCAFLGNDYKWSRSDIIEKVKKQAFRLIDEEDVDTFLVGVKGAYENDAYNAVLDVREERPNIRIVLVVSSMREANEGTRLCNDVALPDKAAIGYKRWCIVHRNNWIIENTDSRKANGDTNADLSMQDFETVIKRMIPMAKMRQEDFKDLRDWANENAVSASVSSATTSNLNDTLGGRRIDLI